VGAVDAAERRRDRRRSRHARRVGVPGRSHVPPQAPDDPRRVTRDDLDPGRLQPVDRGEHADHSVDDRRARHAHRPGAGRDRRAAVDRVPLPRRPVAAGDRTGRPVCGELAVQVTCLFHRGTKS